MARAVVEERKDEQLGAAFFSSRDPDVSDICGTTLYTGAGERSSIFQRFDVGEGAGLVRPSTDVEGRYSNAQ